jgi:hypothetical protein
MEDKERILQADLKDFPKSLQILNTEYGITSDCVKNLFANFAGEKVYIPERQNKDGKLTKAIGAGFAQELIAIFPGNTLELPLGKCLQKKWRDEEVKREIASGASGRLTMKKFRLNRETYRQIKKSITADTN